MTRRGGVVAFAVATCLLANLSPFRADAGPAATQGDAALSAFVATDGPELGALPMRDIDGVWRTLDEHAGKIVLVHFFATWCEPCREEMAGLADVAGELHTPDLRMVAINVAEPVDRVRRFASALRLPFPILLDSDRRLSKLANVTVLPTTLLVDAQGRPRFVATNEVDWRTPAARNALRALITSVQSRQAPAEGASPSGGRP